MNGFPTEVQLIPLWARAEGLTRCFVYNGSSMMPTFHSGHLLYVHPLTQNLAVGDVIVFRHPFNGSYIVHRIVSITEARLFFTRGDNNSHCDASPVLLDQLIGKVEWVDDRGIVRPVLGGHWGLLKAKICWVVRRMDNWFRKVFWHPYRLLRSSGLVARVWHPYIIKLLVQSESGPSVKYLYKQHTVAAWYPLQKNFECRKPYDLVIPPPEGLHNDLCSLGII